MLIKLITRCPQLLNCLLDQLEISSSFKINRTTVHNAQTCDTDSLCQTLLTLREQAGSGLLLGLSQQFLKVPIESVRCFLSGVVLQSAGGDQPADKAESDIKAFFQKIFLVYSFSVQLLQMKQDNNWSAWILFILLSCNIMTLIIANYHKFLTTLCKLQSIDDNYDQLTEHLMCGLPFPPSAFPFQ